MSTPSLQISPTSGGTYVEQARFSNGNTGTLAIGLGIVQTMAQQLSAMVPAGYYVKLISTQNTGTPTITYITGQETLL